MKTCAMCDSDISSRHRLTVYCGTCVGKRRYLLLKARGGPMAGQQLAARFVHLAVRYGLLAPVKTRSCVDCGAPAEHYDHRDYNKPLEVEAVCRKCNFRRGPAKPFEPKFEQQAAAERPQEYSSDRSPHVA